MAITDERHFGGQRKEKRVVVNKEFRSLEHFVNEYVQNISQSGAFVRSDDPLGVGTLVTIHFTLLLDETETIEGEGKVVWTQAPGGHTEPGMGVVFTRLTSYSERLLHKMLAPQHTTLDPTLR